MYKKEIYFLFYIYNYMPEKDCDIPACKVYEVPIGLEIEPILNVCVKRAKVRVKTQKCKSSCKCFHEGDDHSVDPYEGYEDAVVDQSDDDAQSVKSKDDDAPVEVVAPVVVVAPVTPGKSK